jgi:hypothetical protein
MFLFYFNFLPFIVFRRFDNANSLAGFVFSTIHIDTEHLKSMQKHTVFIYWSLDGSRKFVCCIFGRSTMVWRGVWFLSWDLG